MTLALLVKKSLPVLLYTNMVAAAGAGVWLVFTGYVTIVWPLILALLMSPMLLPFFLVPLGLFAGSARIVQGSMANVAKVLNILSVIYLAFILSGYCLVCFRIVYDAVMKAPLPAGIFGVAIALSPWALLGMKDRDNVFFTGLIWMTQITAIAVMAAMASYGWDLGYSFWVFWGTLLVMLGAQSGYEAVFMKTKPAMTPPPSI